MHLAVDTGAGVLNVAQLHPELVQPGPEETLNPKYRRPWPPWSRITQGGLE